MKQPFSIKKYLIRTAGALCILAAVVLLFFPEWIQIRGVKNSQFKEVYAEVETVLQKEETWLLSRIEKADSKEKEELEDYNLPYKKNDIKALFREITTISKEALDSGISLKEITILIFKTPSLIKITQNLLETDNVLYGVVTILVKNNYPQWANNWKTVDYLNEQIQDELMLATDYFSTVSTICYAAILVSILLAIIVIWAIIGHISNKSRWGKYVLLSISLLLVVGGLVGFPIVSDLLTDTGIPLVEDMRLSMSITPILALVLLLVPVILDILSKKWEKKAFLKPVEQTSPNVIDEEVIPTEEQAEEVAEKPVTSKTTVEPKTRPIINVITKCKTTIKRTTQNLFAKLPNETPKKKWFIAGVTTVGTIIAAALILVVVSIATNTYKTPINTMEKQQNSKNFDVWFSQEYKLLNGFAEKEVQEIFKIMKNSDDFMDAMEIEAEWFYDDILDMEDEYGRNYKFSYTIINKEELERDSLKEFRDELREIGEYWKSLEDDTDQFDSDDWEDVADELDLTKSEAKQLVRALNAVGKVCKKAKVTEGYLLTVEIILTGRELDEPEVSEKEFYVYKVDGRWIAGNSTNSLWGSMFF